ncbi:putative phage abortive infection protein [Enterobacter kobei]|uniref:putative phage abortive infection protein n=1 Tax=Enterobacter kobei TaxID=208224 RepID=UPI002FCF40EE
MSIIVSSLITIVFFIIAIISLVVSDNDFYSYLTENWDKAVAFASAVGTVIAAIATWLAARRAAEGAEIARQSMDETGKAAKDTLQETQLYNRRTSFENRYALLLAQHDQYHKQLCDYIDDERRNSSQGIASASKMKVMDFFTGAENSKDCNAVLSFLTGHEIISRYMRTLYHLLKFVEEDFYLDSNDDIPTKKRGYTSPVRSIIRNDVLFMIALNALNVRTSISKSSGYPRYQNLLHFFNFFEHAIFINPLDPNSIFVNTDWEGLIHSHLAQKLEYKYFGKNEIEITKLPKVNIFSPVIACLLVYENPMKRATEEALKTFYVIKKKNIDKKILVEAIDIYNKAKAISDAVKDGYYKKLGSNEWKLVSEDDVSLIKAESILGFTTFKACTFKIKPIDEYSDGANLINSEYVYNSELDLLTNGEIYGKVQEYGGLSLYLDQLQKDYDKNLQEFYRDLASYNVRIGLQ